MHLLKRVLLCALMGVVIGWFSKGLESQDPACCQMVYLRGGSFQMGSSAPVYPEDGEGVRPAHVKPFAIDTCTVTNAAFARFVELTGYVTEAEKFDWSYVWDYVYQGNESDIVMRVQSSPWWLGVRGATWKQPYGPGSSVLGREEHPVVHVSWRDANRYCRWRGGRLPTEAEWEFAARGGLTDTDFPWGNDPIQPHHANTYQGDFPEAPVAEDGFVTTAPVCAFPPNSYGLYQMIGNVWEWVHDNMQLSKGGSFMCHSSYCQRYRISARHKQTPDTSSIHLGFRCTYTDRLITRIQRLHV